MRRFLCQCGQPIFFDSGNCVHCGARLGFDPADLTMRALHQKDQYWQDDNGLAFRFCDNAETFGVCNWLLPSTSPHALCLACRFNRTVPNQSQPYNQERWRRLEIAKKRLFFSLLELQLPLINGWDDPQRGLLLDFIEDNRWQSGTYAETFVNTGYLGGIITINTLEADDALRENQRQQMKESYRTVLGHLRHESGHYYWQLLQADSDTLTQFRDLFGDETVDYQAALTRYYNDGPAPDWSSRCISAYASAHPTEDWAECWGHHLHLFDALETAAAYFLIPAGPQHMSIGERCATWREISVVLNEMNRSLGKSDAYPFVLNSVVEKKLEFVGSVIDHLKTPCPV